MNKRLPVLRFLFVCIMLCCAGILIWLVPANQSVNAAISDARQEIDRYDKLIYKQINVDHVKYLDGILEKQEYLDEALTPELDEYWRTFQIRSTAYDARDVLRSEKSMLEGDIEFYQEVLDEMLHPEYYEALDEEDEEYEDDGNW